MVLTTQVIINFFMVQIITFVVAIVIMIMIMFIIILIIIYMKKLLDSDWLRAVQFKCNTSAKSVTPVQKV